MTSAFENKKSSTLTTQIFKPDLIKNALSLSKDKPITEYELAKLSGFNEKQIEMLKLFWQPCFNKSWIYLSDDLILNNLTNETGKMAITNFYKRILIPNFEVNIDYEEVDIKNNLVKSWYSNLITDIGTRKPPLNKKYYIITGECFKCLLMSSRCEKGKETRKYYIQVENLAINMKDYLLELKDKEIEHITRKHNLFLKRKKRSVYEKGNVVYIVSNYKFDSFYKIGKATQKSEESISAFTSRLSTYNTCSPHNFKVHYLIYLENNTLLENNIKEKYKSQLNPTNKEWIKGVKVEEIISFIRKQCKYLEIEYKDFEYKTSMVENKENEIENEIEDEVEFEIESDDEVESDSEDEVESDDEDLKVEPEINPKKIRYNEILEKLDTYLLKNLREIAKEINIKTYTNKKDYCTAIKNKINEELGNVVQKIDVTPKEEVKMFSYLTFEQKLKSIISGFMPWKDYLKKNKNSLENKRWCRGWCNNFVDVSKFTKNSKCLLSICTKCESTLKLAENKIKNNELSIENIKLDSSLILLEDNKRHCIECKKVKNNNEFEKTRNTCKVCREKMRTEKDNGFYDILESQVKVIKKLSGNDRLERLKTYKKTEIYKIAQYFKITRHSKDVKDDMIVKINNYLSKKN